MTSSFVSELFLACISSLQYGAIDEHGYGHQSPLQHGPTYEHGYGHSLRYSTDQAMDMVMTSVTVTVQTKRWTWL